MNGCHRTPPAIMLHTGSRSNSSGGLKLREHETLTCNCCSITYNTLPKIRSDTTNTKSYVRRSSVASPDYQPWALVASYLVLPSLILLFATEAGPYKSTHTAEALVRIFLFPVFPFPFSLTSNWEAIQKLRFSDLIEGIRCLVNRISDYWENKVFHLEEEEQDEKRVRVTRRAAGSEFRRREERKEKKNKR